MRLQRRFIIYLLIALLMSLVIYKFFYSKMRYVVPMKTKHFNRVNPLAKNQWLHVKILSDTVKKFGKKKLILLWTTFFGDHDYIPKISSLNCPVSNCIITSDRKLLNQSDGLIFHLRDINLNDLPATRQLSQRWIFLHHESPPHTPNILKSLNGLFNWTATYRRDSDIFLSPTVKKQDQYINPRNYAENKTRMVAWFASNCNTPSNRERFVEELKKSLPVDIYGTCGELSCLPKMSNECYNKVAQSYRYYLAFENSICEDYVTEKFYNILNTNMVPVVLGGANYSLFAPPNSYIDALSFINPHNLAHFLLSVAKDEKKFNSYFDWKSTHKLHSEHYACQICEKLHKESESYTYDDLESWWLHSANCRSWEPIKKVD